MRFGGLRNVGEVVLRRELEEGLHIAEEEVDHTVG